MSDVMENGSRFLRDFGYAVSRNPVPAALIGVNNRDLRSFTTDLAVSERLRPLVPAPRIMVAESGIHTRADVARLRRSAIGAFLVGEAFMRAADPGTALRELFAPEGHRV